MLLLSVEIRIPALGERTSEKLLKSLEKADSCCVKVKWYKAEEWISVGLGKITIYSESITEKVWPCSKLCAVNKLKIWLDVHLKVCNKKKIKPTKKPQPMVYKF